MTMLCILCYFVSVGMSFEEPSFRLLFSNSYFLFVTGVFIMVGSFFYERLRISEFALRAEVEKSRETLRSQFQRLGELDEAKTRFFANISHELRTPLTIMLGITERIGGVLKPSQVDPKVPEMVHLLSQNGLRLMKLIDDLLDLVRFDTGETDVVTQKTLICPHFEGLMKSLQHVADEDGVTLLWESKSVHEAVILDRDKFDKIVLNLVINAIKFTPSGGNIDVILKISEARLDLAVKDTGVGITQEHLERIFERFWQVDTSSTRKLQGSGIGLALVRSLAQAMGGAVGAQSQVGVGTTFNAYFPIQKCEMKAKAEEPVESGRNIVEIHRKAALAIPSKARGAEADPKNIQNPSIGERETAAKPLVLIADDEPDIRRFLVMQLDDVEILEASDGAEALELAKIHRPQIALLDQHDAGARRSGSMS